MPSIIDVIAKAEEEAANIRKLGAANAREIIDNANDTVAQSIAEAKEKAEYTVARRREASVKAGRRLASDIFNARSRESARIMETAATRKDEVIAYIVERVMHA